jgi:hypothetical protein
VLLAQAFFQVETLEIEKTSMQQSMDAIQQQHSFWHFDLH